MRRIFTLFIVLMLSTVFAFAQNRVVTGSVTDEKGTVIEGASVKVLGSKLGVAADINGNFKITVPPKAVLVFSGTGLVTREVTVGDQTVINAALTRTGAVELTNVIVTAQGIRRQPKELGYSTARLSNSEITQGKVINVANGLTGKVSGLQVSTVNNGVNPTTRITLRGNRSILGNNQALLVLDDMPVSLGYLNSINPNDIDNITVLKGASAAALYGSQASNGVLIVTTKRGTKGKPIIRYSNTTEIEEIAYLPKLQNQFGPFGGEYDANQYPGVQYFPTDPFRPYVPYENQNYGPAFNGLPITIGAPVRFYNADGTFFDSLKHGTYTAQPNAKKGFFDKGLTIQNDFSVSGGDDKSKFFFSVQDVDVKGIVPGDKTHRDVQS
jgi:TonB-dependent SusC/RagA subfamily outer membrane receptor